MSRKVSIQVYGWYEVSYVDMTGFFLKRQIHYSNDDSDIAVRVKAI